MLLHQRTKCHQLETNDDLKLVEFLRTTLIGRALLVNYKQKQTLSSSTRTYLVHSIVDGIMNRLVLISSAIMNNIAEEIAKLAPTEIKAVYLYSRMLNEKMSSEKLIDC